MLTSNSPIQQSHIEIMRLLCKAVQDTPLVLKGGTALLLCYKLDRFSEDLDFDSGKKISLQHRISTALKKSRFSVCNLSVLKDTDTVQRLRLTYFDSLLKYEGKLKIEISLRNSPDPSHIVFLSNVKTYSLNELFRLKCLALFGRTTARDFYDIQFILNDKNFIPDKNSFDKIYHTLSNPSLANDFKKQFQIAFKTDPILNSLNFDNIFQSLVNSVNSRSISQN